MTDRARRRAAASDTASREDREDNPFAPPPEGKPDQPWQPRRAAAHEGSGPEGSGAQGSGSQGTDAQGSAPQGSQGSGSQGSGSHGSGSQGSGGQDSGSRGGSPDGSSQDGEQQPWSSRWSSRQPGRQSGGFGGQGGQDGAGGEGPGGAPRGMRWDPTDPLQRRARYALHAGIWGLFFALFSLPPVALLLGALSLYWGISALRGTSATRRGERPAGQGHGKATAEDIAGSARAPEERGAPLGGAQGGQGQQPQVSVTPAQAAKSQASAAIGGLVTAMLTLAVVAGTFAFQMAYKDYFTCQQDALTQSSRQSCDKMLPDNLRPFLENRGGNATQ
ncbi:hypothetical protein [Streptomyces sp. ODS28]|uniref:hypothetical protein n=1 Tax=Streptomyces sp. ODS28 TaxID=3136688 RepID=UPI0031E87C96